MTKTPGPARGLLTSGIALRTRNRRRQPRNRLAIHKPKACGTGSRSALTVLQSAGTGSTGTRPREAGYHMDRPTDWETMEDTLGSTNTSTKQQWIAEQARTLP